MNTLTIAILVVCATMAYAAVLPGPAAGVAIQSAPVAETDLEGQETAGGFRGHYGGGHHGGFRNYGYGHHGYGGHGHHGHRYGYHGHRRYY